MFFRSTIALILTLILSTVACGTDDELRIKSIGSHQAFVGEFLRISFEI